MLDLQGFGKNFVWWMGVVEDRKDPKRLGRCRVRVFGYHTADKNDIPTDELPWASTVSPIESASMSGIGNAPVGPVEGTHVFGFFRDGGNAQFPVIVGTIPGIPEEASDTSNNEGFKDPNEKYPKDEDKHGLNESDLSRLTRYRWEDENGEQTESEYPPVVQDKKDNRVKDVPVANGHGSFSEPETAYDAKYPYNHVTVTESGHIYEMDDTLNKERIHEYHRSGTFREIFPKGTAVTKVVRDNYEFVLGDNFVNIKKAENEGHGGNLYITIEGDVYEFVKGNVERQINGSVREVIGGNYHTHVNGDRTINVEGSQAEKIHEDVTEEYYNHTTHTLGNVKRLSEGTIVVESPKKISMTSAGGNINIQAHPHSAGNGLSGKINLSAGDAMSLRSEKNMNIYSSAGGVGIAALDGGVSVMGSANILMRSNIGEVQINSASTMHIISAKNMLLSTPENVTIKAKNVIEEADQQCVRIAKVGIADKTDGSYIEKAKTKTTAVDAEHTLITGTHTHGCNGDINVNSGGNQRYTSGGNIYLN